MLWAKLKGGCPRRQEPSRAASWCKERRLQVWGKHCHDGWEDSAKLRPNCPVAANLLEAEHRWQRAEEQPLALPAELNSAEFSQGSQCHCTHLIERELRHRLLKGLGQLRTTSPEQAQLLASTVFTGLQRGPLPAEHLTLFSAEVPILLFRHFLYAFCIA